MGAPPFFKDTLRADFAGRPDRFTVACIFEGRKVKAHLPNPGRLQELLLPGARLWLEKSHSGAAGLRFTAVAVEREGRPVVVHTGMTNSVARYLLEAGRVPGLEGSRIVGAEVRRGRSRFDFLLNRGGREVLLEVKSCTLFSDAAAMFPDAVTERGRRHLVDLARLAAGGSGAAVLFLVNSLVPAAFLPDYHTDLKFSRTLLAVRAVIQIIPLAIGWGPDLALEPATRLLPIPWERIESEAQDRGAYLVVLRLRQRMMADVGSLGRIGLLPGYYVYVGSAMRNLSRRIERHRRLQKKAHWHIDRLRPAAEWIASLPIRTAERVECGLAAAVRRVAAGEVRGFGCSDCGCPSHLFFFEQDPFATRAFHAVVQHFRMDRPARR